MSKFKVGDKVVACQSSAIANIGDEGVIVKIEKWDKDDIIPYCVDFGKGRTLWMEKNQLRLKKEKKMETVFELVMGKHVVEVRGGYRYLLVKQEGDTIVGLNLDDSTAYTTLVLDENLQDIENHNFDIKRVYEYGNRGFSYIKEKLSDPVWERKEVKEMTMEEICKALGYDVKIKEGG